MIVVPIVLQDLFDCVCILVFICRLAQYCCHTARIAPESAAQSLSLDVEQSYSFPLCTGTGAYC